MFAVRKSKREEEEEEKVKKVVIYTASASVYYHQSCCCHGTLRTRLMRMVMILTPFALKILLPHFVL